MTYMYIQKVISRNFFWKLVFSWHLEGQWRKLQDPDPLVRGMDPRILIHTKMSWIRWHWQLTTELHPICPQIYIRDYYSYYFITYELKAEYGGGFWKSVLRKGRGAQIIYMCTIACRSGNFTDVFELSSASSMFFGKLQYKMYAFLCV
jgi:hypothetical protein